MKIVIELDELGDSVEIQRGDQVSNCDFDAFGAFTGGTTTADDFILAKRMRRAARKAYDGKS